MSCKESPKLPFARRGVAVHKIQKLFSGFIRDLISSLQKEHELARLIFERIYVLFVFSSSSYCRKPLLDFFNDSKCLHISSFPSSLPCAFVTAGREQSGICKNPTVLFCEVLTKAERLYISPCHCIKKTEQTNMAGKSMMCT